MTRPPPSSTRTATLVPYPPLFPSAVHHDRLEAGHASAGGAGGTAAAWLRQHRPADRSADRDADARGRAGIGISGYGGEGGCWWLGTRPALPCLKCWSRWRGRSEEHTSELQSLKRISYAVLCV